MPDLNHFDLPETPPSGPTWTPDVTYVVVVDYDGSVPRKIIFRKTLQTEMPTPPDEEPPVEPVPPTNGELLHHVRIEEDCYILIWLSGNVDWHWHKSRAITTAANIDQYFKLQYWTAAGWQSPPVEGETTRCVRIGAKFRGGSTTKEDLFNMNVELENPEGPPLPITIDPDIQNPKA